MKITKKRLDYILETLGIERTDDYDELYEENTEHWKLLDKGILVDKMNGLKSLNDELMRRINRTNEIQSLLLKELGLEVTQTPEEFKASRIILVKKKPVKRGK